MTKIPTDEPALISLPAEAGADLFRGYLHVISNLAEGWSIGLIFDEGAREEDAQQAEQLQTRYGCPVFWLAEEEMLTLGMGARIELRARGRRHLLVVDDVEELEKLLREEFDDNE
jgi:hypothetical protein